MIDPRLDTDRTPPRDGELRLPGPMPSGTVALVAGAGVLAVVAFLLRYRAVGASTLWLDDSWVAVGAQVGSIDDTLRAGLTSPGFSLLYRGWAGGFGSSAAAAQVLGLVFGVLAPPLVFLVAAERGLHKVAAFIGGLVLATAPAHIEYSVRLKQYSAEAFASTLVLWAGWRVLDRPGDGRRWALLGGFGIAASGLSSVGAITTVCTLGVALVAAVLARPSRLRPALVTIASFVAVSLPWMLLVVRPNVGPELGDYWHRYYLDGPGGPVRRVEQVARWFMAWPTGLVVAIVVAAAVVVLVRRPFVGALLISPTVVAFLLAALSLAPIGTGRTDIYLYPGYALLIAAAADELSRFVRPRPRLRVGAGALALVAVIALIANADALDSSSYPREDVAPLVRLVEERRAPGELIVIYPWTSFAYANATRHPIAIEDADRFATGWGVKVGAPGIVTLPPHRERPADYGPALDAVTERSQPIWLIGSHLKSDWPVIQQMVEARGYRREAVFRRPGAALIRYVHPLNP